MGYAVYHTEKGKISSGGIGKHIDREQGAEHTYRHSDPAKRNLNQSFIITEHCRKPLHQAISDRISEGYSAKNKAGELKQIRKDAVKYSTHILTGSHEDMKRIEANPEELKKWVQANLKFASEEFGKENIVRFVLHRDEKTPHLHVVTVNLTKDGRLSAKEILGNPKAMQERQDRYAEQMKSFGLERGLKNTGIDHEDAKAFYARMKQSVESGKVEDLEAKRSVLGVDLGVDKDKTIENLKTALIAEKTANKANNQMINNLKFQKSVISEQSNRYESKSKTLEKEKESLIVNRDDYERQRAKFIDDVAERRVFLNFERDLQRKINNSETFIHPEQVGYLSNELFLSRLKTANLKKHIESDLMSSQKVRERILNITNNQSKKQAEIIEKNRAKRFEIALLQTKLDLLERVEKKEFITKNTIEKKAFEMLKKEFPNENVMQIPAKYSNLKENYLDYLEQRVKQYQQWEKEGVLQEVKENGRQELVRLTNPTAYELIMERKRQQEQEESRTRGMRR